MSLSRQEKLAWLEKVPLLRKCDAKVLEHIADVSGELPFADGEAIVLHCWTSAAPSITHG